MDSAMIQRGYYNLQIFWNNQEQEGWNKVGLSVHDLYSQLYQEEFRFELRHQRNMVHVEPKERAFEGFVAANFGSFPTQERAWVF